LSRSSSRSALRNQCWKDSEDSIVFSNGQVAKPPIATCEQQGYAYDARVRAARLMREFYGDSRFADLLEDEAASLKERFNRRFWDRRKGFYILALDCEKRSVDAVTSNPGHLLWSGIVDDGRAQATVRRLLADDMVSGWGVRTLSSEYPAYDPLSYHRGSVWPHDTALAAEGMRRYGFRAEASRLAVSGLEAADRFGGQLPELFAGFQRDSADRPVEYPDALRPQAWAAGAPLLGLRTLLGLDIEEDRLSSRPCLPESMAELRIKRLSVRGRYVDVPRPG
jgi:glycogen debranching enzyme